MAVSTIVRRLQELGSTDRDRFESEELQFEGGTCYWWDSGSFDYLRRVFPGHAFFEVTCLSEGAEEHKTRRIYDLELSTAKLTQLRSNDDAQPLDGMKHLIDLSRTFGLRIADEAQAKAFVSAALDLVGTPVNLRFVCGNSKFGEVIKRTENGWEVAATVDGTVNYAWKLVTDKDGRILEVDREAGLWPPMCQSLSADECPGDRCDVRTNCAGERVCDVQHSAPALACGSIGSYGDSVECCPGLSRRCGSIAPDGSCDAAVSWNPWAYPECLPCGDGICQRAENRCSCPEDCLASPDRQSIRYEGTDDMAILRCFGERSRHDQGTPDRNYERCLFELAVKQKDPRICDLNLDPNDESPWSRAKCIQNAYDARRASTPRDPFRSLRSTHND